MALSVSDLIAGRPNWTPATVGERVGAASVFGDAALFWTTKTNGVTRMFYSPDGQRRFSQIELPIEAGDILDLRVSIDGSGVTLGLMGWLSNTHAYRQPQPAPHGWHRPTQWSAPRAGRAWPASGPGRRRGGRARAIRGAAVPTKPAAPMRAMCTQDSE